MHAQANQFIPSKFIVLDLDSCVSESQLRFPKKKKKKKKEKKGRKNVEFGA